MEDTIHNYHKQGYRTLEIPTNPNNPKALVRQGWNTEPTNTDIAHDRLYAVIQEERSMVIDIDDISLNGLLEDYVHKTLVIQTGNGGRHYYFKDISRLEKYKIKSSPLYKDGKHVGDIKAGTSYVIGCNRSYKDPKDDKIKSYDKISSTSNVLETDCYDILNILKNVGITPKKDENAKSKNSSSKIDSQLSNGLQEGERDNESFKTACNLFEEGISKDNVRKVLITINNTSPKPLPENQIDSVLNSACKRIDDKKKQQKKSSREIIEETAIQIMSEKQFVTLSKTNEILTWNGKIYTNENAESYIKSRTDKLVFDCTQHIRLEVLDKIKARTYKSIIDFDSDPDKITLLNGVLNVNSLEISDHTPDNLSQILIPVEYHPPKFPINDETIFDDIEKNLKDTLWWKFATSSFTINGKLQETKRESILEILASIFIKHQIDQRGFIFLGTGNNGKSVFIEYAQDLLGKDNYSNETLHDLTKDRFAPASLLGKLANLFSDIESDELNKDGTLKAILAGEGISAQFKNGQKFKLVPFCKMIFSCNRFPKVIDQTESFFRRWIIVKWERSFEGDPEQDKTLVDKLKSNQEEKNLVFSTIIHLSRKLYQTREFSHTKKASELRTEWNANADPLETFIENWIIMDDGSKKGIRETYAFYKIKMEEAGERALNIRQFGRQFAESFDQSHSNSTRYWVGIDFREPTQTKLGDGNGTLL